jgi:hypothetical protein
MNTFFKFVAYLGIGLLIFAAFMAWWSTTGYLTATDAHWRNRYSFEWTSIGYLFGFVVGFIGMIPCLIGGIKAKASFLWAGLTGSAVVYCLAYIIGIIYTHYKALQFPEVYPGKDISNNDSYMIWFLLPGIIVLIESIILMLLRKRKNKQQTPENNI